MDYNSLDDKELAKMLSENKDELAYAVIYNRYFYAIKNFIGPIIKTDSYKEDLTQEIFIKVFNKIHLYKPEYKFTNWIYRIATNSAIDFLRKEKNKKTFSIEKSNKEGEIFEMQIPGKGISPLQVFVLQQRKEFLNTVLNSLETPLKNLIVDKFIKEETYKKLSEEMEVPVNTLKTWVSRVKQSLRDNYNLQYQCF